MEKRFFKLDEAACNELALRIFTANSGINKEGRKFERMRKDAFRMREMIEDKIDLHAEAIYYTADEMELSGQTLEIAGTGLSCRAFEQISPDAVEGVYLYACCAGDYYLEDEPIMDQLYADIWGTAFTDAVRLLIKKELEKDAALSDSFGPGFYGMELTELEKLAQLLDFDALGIEVRNSCVMVPVKSCAGIYFQTNENYRKMNRACESCYGTHTSCKLCMVHGERG